MKQMVKKWMAKVLVVAMLLSMVVMTPVQAAKAPKFSTKKIKIQVGKNKTLSVKNTKKIKKVKWKVKNKKIASIKKKSKYKYVVKGLKKGTTKVTCKVTFKSKKKKAKTLTCTVNVTKRINNTTSTMSPVATEQPTPTVTATPAPTQAPPVTSIKAAYQPILGEMGNCVSLSQLQDAETLEYVKLHYSSITLENEMKPEAILKNDTLVSTETAKANTEDYVIPESYEESTVPRLNFDTVDQVLKIAYDNNLKMRAHTLVWHSQTPEWFFKVGYSNSGSYVSEEVMDARLEMWVRSVIQHVYTIEGGKYKDTVYAWDVTNEYLHNNANGNWSKVYGNRSGNLETSPGYVKTAFQIAHDELKNFELEDKVSLFYNDYNTYVAPDDVIALIDFINEGKEEWICDGVGMQSHLDVDYPSAEVFNEALTKFAAKGYEIQITEFDATINNDQGNYHQDGQKRADQAPYVKAIMDVVVAQKKAGANITGFTIWGLCDQVSWRGALQRGGNSHPTLFWRNINEPKPSYYSFMEAAKNY